MTFYRKYKAAYTFDKRSATELSMTSGDILIVEQNSDGTWPPPEKWMQGFNERSGETGEFPGGAYVELVEEFRVDPDPPVLLDRPSELPPLPSPRHAPTEVPGSTYNGGKREETSEESPPPPPPPRRRGNSRGSQDSGPPPTIPKPIARKQRKSVEVLAKRHAWAKVTFRIPVQCTACEFQERSWRHTLESLFLVSLCYPLSVILCGVDL